MKDKTPPLMDKESLVDSLFHASSTERPWLVLQWATKLEWTAGRIFWEVIHETWSMFDLIPHKEFQQAFRHFKLFAPREGLPPRVTIYRGQSRKAALGLAWTTSRTVAESFARGHRAIMVPDPVIYSLEVTARQIAFVCNDREENEIVLFSPPRKLAKGLSFYIAQSPQAQQ